MATIIATPFIVKDTIVSLGANDYSAAISKAQLVPTTPTAAFKSVNGIPYNLAGKSSWVLTLDFAQDWTGSTSLANYLFDNEGLTVAFEIRPTGTTSGFKGSLVLAPGAIGDAADAVAGGSVSFQVVGKPIRITV